MRTKSEQQKNSKEQIDIQALYQKLLAYSTDEYIAGSRANGKALIDKRLLRRAAELYEELERACIGKLQQSNISPQNVPVNACVLARYVLHSDWYYYKHEIPRYNYYANMSVLRWSLDRLTQFVRNRREVACWVAIKALIDDQVQHERKALRDHSKSVSEREAGGRIKTRLTLLDELSTHLPEFVHHFTDDVWMSNSESGDWITWSKYAKDATGISALLDLTAFPQSTVHDEYLFIRTIHITECCFDAIHDLLNRMMASAELGDFGDATKAVISATDFANLLTPLFVTLKTMPPQNFLAFRPHTGNSSAVQSASYQRLQQRFEGMPAIKKPIVLPIPEVAEFATPLAKYECARTLLDNIPETENHFIDAIYSLDQALYRWRCLHLGIARTYLADVRGTGGTDGVKYLESHFKHRLKP